nr:MAG TPA: hypothetical protein [Caudoviricetes sp.]
MYGSTFIIVTVYRDICIKNSILPSIKHSISY